MYEFLWRYHWNLFLRVQLTILQHWFRWMNEWVNEWISNFIPHLTSLAITYPCWDWSYSPCVWRVQILPSVQPVIHQSWTLRISSSVSCPLPWRRAISSPGRARPPRRRWNSLHECRSEASWDQRTHGIDHSCNDPGKEYSDWVELNFKMCCPQMRILEMQNFSHWPEENWVHS